MKIGIDASNLRSGGGVTHLIEILNVFEPSNYSFDSICIVVFGNKKTLNKISNKNWLIKKSNYFLEKNLFFRTFWQFFILKWALKNMKCDILFSPGGRDQSNFKPMVTMSRNMLPFEYRELFKFGWSFMTLKLLFLRFLQIKTFNKSDGLIFLSEYAKKKVSTNLNTNKINTVVIQHGINMKFYLKPRPQKSFKSFISNNPCKIIYVSTLDPYKHHINIINAVKNLNKKGIPISLILVGSIGQSFKKIQKEIYNYENIINYYGEISYENLQDFYLKADIGIFASSCENLPNILLEKMASGLPIVSSNYEPMPEVLRNGGLYFNPESVFEIEEQLEKLVRSKDLRETLSKQSFQIAELYSWEKCSEETFNFINKCYKLSKLK